MIKSPYRIKWYFAGLTLIVLILLALNYVAVPNFVSEEVVYKEALVSFLNNMIALSISGIVASWALLFFTPRTLKNSDIDIVNPHDISHMLEALASKTECFCYLGHTARWNRAVTLEKLKCDAESRKTRKDITLIILDPDNNFSCEYYCNFGHASRDKGNKISNANDVRTELLSTVLACMRYQQSPFLDINLFVTDKVSFFRLDISDTAILLTKPYSDEPALHFPKDTFFYSSYKEEFKIVRDQSRRINIDASEPELSPENCAQLLEKAGVSTDGLDKKMIEKIISCSNSSVRPY